MSWDSRKDQILRNHYGKGLKTASEIASLIGDGTTRNSVIGRASRLGLSGNINVKKKSKDDYRHQNIDNTQKRGKRSKFVLNKEVFDYIDNRENCIFERSPLQNLSRDGQLMAFKHEGFWHPMDTLRDKNYLNKICRNRKFIWKK